MLIDGISSAFRGGIIVHLLIPPTTIGSVPSLSDHAIASTDGVHCREVPGAGPVVLKEVPVKGAAFSGFTMVQFMRLSFPPLTIGILTGFRLPDGELRLIVRTYTERSEWRNTHLVRVAGGRFQNQEPHHLPRSGR